MSSQLIVSAALFVLSALMLVMSLRIGARASVQAYPAAYRLRDLSSRYLASRGESAWKRYREVSRHLRLAGYVGLRTHIVVLLLAMTLVVAVAVAGVLVLQPRSSGSPVVLALSCAAATSLALLFVLRARIRWRERQMEDRIEILLQLTRMLWSTGMTMEMQFRQLVTNLHDIAPAISFEINVALGRIESGQPREDVLEQLARHQPYNGMSDYFRLLAQLSSTGGRAVQSLQVLSDLLRDARRARLQEKLTRMSAKMSLVMILCFFPALLVFLAGPALVNLGDMFQSMSR